MPPAKRRKKPGPKPKQDKRVALLIRVYPDLKDRLESLRGNLSLSRFAEKMLSNGLASTPGGQSDSQAAIAYLLNSIVAALESVKSEKVDFENATDFLAFKAGVGALLDRLTPKGEFDPDRLRVSDKPSENPVLGSPEEAGRTLSSLAWMLLTHNQEAMMRMAEQSGAQRGSLFFAFPKAAQTLKIKGDK